MKKTADLLLIILAFCFLLPTSLHAQSGWSEDTQVVYLPGTSWYPRAACNGDTIHLVWWQHYAHDEVFYKRSTDAGLTWGDDVRLSIEDTQSSVLSQIAVSDNTVHVIWFEDDYGLLYRRSMDGGESWESIDSIVPGMTYSSICAIGDTVYIAGTIGSLGVLRFTKSYDGGNTWQSIIEITKASSSPRIRNISSDALNLVVSYDKGGSPVGVEVYQVLSYNGGETWFDSLMISHNDSIHSFRPAMTADSISGIHIGWADYKYSPYAWTGDIFYRASRDSGNTWEEIDSLTIMHRAVASDILAEGSNLHLVWEDDRHGFDNNFEIYYRQSTDLGQTWEPEVRLTNALYHSYCPSLACGGAYLHLFWQDRRNDSNNVTGKLYYKRTSLIGVKEIISEKYLSSDLFLDCSTIISRNSSIRFDLGGNNEGEIKVIDVVGRVIETLPLHQVSGEFVFKKEVQNGVYFIMLKVGSDYITRKVLVVR